MYESDNLPRTGLAMMKDVARAYHDFLICES